MATIETHGVGHLRSYPEEKPKESPSVFPEPYSGFAKTFRSGIGLRTKSIRAKTGHEASRDIPGRAPDRLKAELRTAGPPSGVPSTAFTRFGGGGRHPTAARRSTEQRRSVRRSMIGSGAGDCAPAPSHTTGRAVCSHPAVEQGRLLPGSGEV